MLLSKTTLMFYQELANVARRTAPQAKTETAEGQT